MSIRCKVGRGLGAHEVTRPVSLWVTALIMLGAPALSQQGDVSPFELKWFAIDGDWRRFALYSPPGERGDKDPVVVYLHSDAACGLDGWGPTNEGLGRAVRLDPERWPFRIVFPQKSTPSELWDPGIVTSVLQASDVGVSPVVLTGLSEGADGALAVVRSRRWAAVVPVGAQEWRPVEECASWTFLSAGTSSRLVREARRRTPWPSALTVCELNGYQAWDQAYRKSNLAEWIRVLGVSDVAAQVLSGVSCNGIEITMQTTLQHRVWPLRSRIRISGAGASWTITQGWSSSVMREWVESSWVIKEGAAKDAVRSCLVLMAQSGVFEWSRSHTRDYRQGGDVLSIARITLGGSGPSSGPVISSRTRDLPAAVAEALAAARDRLWSLVR